ncbi:sigma-54 dependent transcriptional regulator [Sinobaca sp. H24]|uniref:sigma-54-dependent transcriptional regulator n=1 Tax=Sinobaca sp. H24 TaxID=2923376 RepID=UPI0020795157|nr:sigma-54 dependent transcriptional regulator [Sinobaca sp. H24]
MNILVVDDDRDIGDFFTYLLDGQDHTIHLARNGKEFHQLMLAWEKFDMAFIDIKLPDTNGLRLLKEIRLQQPGCRCIVMTGYSTIESAVEAIKLGAEDYIEKPFENIAFLEEKVNRKDNVEQTNVVEYAARKSGMVIGRSKAMQELVRLASRFAPKPLTILIDGETGSGKEVVARFIHEAAGEKERPFLGVNFGALPENVIESELFGHEAGAFTGAQKVRRGFFEMAKGGTLLLDEIGEASLSTQVKLLRVLESKEFFRVGGERSVKSSARIIAATNRSLHEALESGHFREDLLYRLEVVCLTIPPLRERKEDIPELVEAMLQKEGPDAKQISHGALKKLESYTWPGNIRELANVLARASAHADEKIEADHILFHGNGKALMDKAEEAGPISNTWVDGRKKQLEEDDYLSLEKMVDEMRESEKKAVQQVIDHTLMMTRGNRQKAAERLGVNTRKLRYWLNE